MDQQRRKIKLRRFASSTTIHGLNELIVEPSKWLKLVWTVFLVASVFFCCWQLSAAITEYHKGPTSMKPSFISYDHLPPINFHVMNVINFAKLEAIGLGLSHYKLILDRFPMMPLSEPLDSTAATLARDQLMEVQEKLGFTDFTEFIKSVAYQPEELFGFHMGIEPNITLHINEMGLFYKVKLNCSNANKQGPKYLEQIKGCTSWVVVRDRAKHDGHFNIDDIVRGVFSGFSNIWISIGNDTHDTNKWIAIQQKATRVYIESQLTRFIQKSVNPCSVKYQTVAECQNLCILESLKIPDSDCEWYIGHPINQSRVCEGILDIKEFAYPERCNKPEICPRACVEWKHSKDSNFVQPISNPHGDTWVALLASSTEVAVLEEYYTYSSISLFSNVGGILSLYLGASVLSIVHVIYYFSCKTKTWEEVSKKVIKKVQDKY